MKKLFFKKILKTFVISVFLLLISLYLNHLISNPTDALSPSPTTIEQPTKSRSPTASSQISDLKERIASRVAQLKLVERRGVIGTVTDRSDTQITISDLNSNTRFVDVDELTKFSSPSAKGSFGISDITKGSKVGILGLYNKQSRRILARFVDVISAPKIIRGAIISVDSKEYTIKFISDDENQFTIEVENITKTLSYTKKGGLEKSGFSKIKGNEHVIVAGFPDIKNKTRIIASRIILFPEIPVNPKIKLPTQDIEPALNSQETVPPSTGSGKKLAPITR